MDAGGGGSLADRLDGSVDVERGYAVFGPTGALVFAAITGAAMWLMAARLEPCGPSKEGITMRAARSGPVARKGMGQTPAAYKGQPPTRARSLRRRTRSAKVFSLTT